MFVVSRFGALRRIAPAALSAALLAPPAAALEGLPELSRQASVRPANAHQANARQTRASDFTTISTRADAAREAGRLDEARFDAWCRSIRRTAPRI
jgi:hypothetical protein